MTENHKCIFCDRVIFGRAMITQAGILHDTCKAPYDRKIEGLIYDCPKCRTTGKIDHPDKEKENIEVGLALGESPMCAWNGCMGCYWCRNKLKEISVIKRVECDLCHGIGYLKKKPKPITDIVNWELEDQ